jgi:hypothetical protein
VGLFNRKRRQPDFIDLGGDQVAISPERAAEWADVAVKQIVDACEEPVAAEVNDALGAAVLRRHPGAELGAKLGSWLASVARLGYGARQYEESFESTESWVQMLAEQLQLWLDARETVAGALVEVSLALCDSPPDDPSAPRSLDAIPGLGDIRKEIRHRTLLAAAGMAHQIGLAEDGELPDGVEASELVAAWNIGFLVRSCESSLPVDVSLTIDTNRRVIVVDIWAVEAAYEEWLLDNPDASEAACSEMMEELIESSRFHLDPSAREEPEGADTDTDARYSLFEVDQNGRLISEEGNPAEQVSNDEDELDPVAEKLAQELGMAAPGGPETSWMFWVGTRLIDIGMWVFRELEAISEDGQPVFPDMARYVNDPQATEVSTRFIAAAYPALSSRMCEIGEDRWEAWGIEEWRHLDQGLHHQMFQILVEAWGLPDDQLAYLTEFAARDFSSEDQFRREFMAYPWFQKSAVQQAYLLPSGKSARNDPALETYLAGGEVVSTGWAIHVAWHRGLCDYLRSLKYYTEEVNYREP